MNNKCTPVSYQTTCQATGKEEIGFPNQDDNDLRYDNTSDDAIESVKSTKKDR